MPKTYEQRKNEPYRLALSAKLPEHLDRRRKLPTSEHEDIRRRHAKGESQRELAKAYGVSRRLIVFVLHPERLELQRARKKDQHYSRNYYQANVKGEKWRKIMQEHRAYKKALKLTQGNFNSDKTN